LKKLGEGLVLFVAIGMITGVDIGISLLCTFIYVMYSFLTIGINFFSLRFTGQEGKAGLVLMLYMLSIVGLLLPGIIAAVVLALLLPGIGIYLGLAALGLWELIVGVISFALS
jgi:hypothetical protein